MYVWSYSDCLFNEARPYESLCGVSDYLAFQNLILANVTNPWNSFAAYNRIYVEIDPALFATNSSIVSSFVALAHSMGVAVEFLGPLPFLFFYYLYFTYSGRCNVGRDGRKCDHPKVVLRRRCRVQPGGFQLDLPVGRHPL